MSDMCIIVKGVLGERVIYFVLLYIPPNDQYAFNLSTVMLDINTHTDDTKPIYILGDFNSRIANFQTPLPEEGQNFCNDLNLTRKTSDLLINTRGRHLIKSLCKHALVVLNGTSRTDVGGHFTFVSHTGKSTIDMALTNIPGLNLVSDFKVLPHSESDHFPISVTLTTYESFKMEHNLRTKTTWDSKIKKAKLTEICEQFRLNLELSSEEKLFETLLKEVETVLRTIGVIKEVNSTFFENHKPWINTSTRSKKKEMKKKLVQFKNDPTTDKLNEYIKVRTLYRKANNLARRNYWHDISFVISEARSSNEFWRLLRKFKFLKPKSNYIEMETWETYLKDMHVNATQVEVERLFFEQKVEELDTAITKDELLNILQKSRGKTAPGNDHIPINLWKSDVNLITNSLLKSLNLALEKQYFPEQWSMIKQFPIFKKGDPSVPSNYRLISILNSSFKVFTAILNTRLSSWAERNEVIPQTQFAFRPTRSTDEPIFILSMLTLKQLNKKNELHTVFIDLSKAFDCVNHHLLWNKLYKLGISYNLIHTLHKLYSNMWTHFEKIDPIKINNGVLQGDSLSPSLFNLFLADFSIPQEYGIDLNNNTVLTHLLFADDIVLLADNHLYLQKSLDATVKFMKGNGLNINLVKTKHMVFTNHPRRPQRTLFIEGEKLERVKIFNYLGVDFQSNLKWKRTINKKVNESINSFHLIWAPLYKMKFGNLRLAFKLFDLQILPKTLYGIHVWGMDNTGEVERVQNTFIKKMMYLPPQTAGYALRLEFSRDQIQTKIFKRALKFWMKMANMDDKRLTKICLLEALKLFDKNKANTWLLEFEKRLHTIGQSLSSAYFEAANNQVNYVSWTRKYTEQLKREDGQRMLQTHTYNGLQFTNYDYDNDIYLFRQSNIKLKRLVLRLRLETNSIYINDSKLTIDPTNSCTWCNEEEHEDWAHLFFRCVYLSEIRPSEWFMNNRMDGPQMVQKLRLMSCKHMYVIYNFLQNANLKRNQWKL